MEASRGCTPRRPGARTVWRKAAQPHITSCNLSPLHMFQFGIEVIPQPVPQEVQGQDG